MPGRTLMLSCQLLCCCWRLLPCRALQTQGMGLRETTRVSWRVEWLGSCCWVYRWMEMMPAIQKSFLRSTDLVSGPAQAAPIVPFAGPRILCQRVAVSADAFAHDVDCSLGCSRNLLHLRWLTIIGNKYMHERCLTRHLVTECSRCGTSPRMKLMWPILNWQPEGTPGTPSAPRTAAGRWSLKWHTRRAATPQGCMAWSAGPGLGQCTLLRISRALSECSRGRHALPVC